MSDLIVIGYPDEHRAHDVWAELVKLGHDYLVDLEDAAIIWREENGKVHVTTPAAAATSPGDAHDHEMAKRWGKPVELNRRRRDSRTARQSTAGRGRVAATRST